MKRLTLVISLITLLSAACYLSRPVATPLKAAATVTPQIPLSETVSITSRPHATTSRTPSSTPTYPPLPVIPTVTPALTTFEPTSTTDPQVVQLSWGNGQNRYQEILDDASSWNLPITALPELPSAANFYTLWITPTPPVGGTLISVNLAWEDRSDNYAVEAARYFENHASGGVTILDQWLRAQNLLCAWDKIEVRNVNGDDTLEYIFPISIPYPGETSGCKPDTRYDRFSIIYLMSCGQSPSGFNCRVFRASKTSFGSITHWDYLLRDLTNDAAPELLLHSHQCGASDCNDSLLVVDLKRKGFDPRYLSPEIAVHNGSIMAQDDNQDGIYEIYAVASDFPGYLGGLTDAQGNPLWGPFNRRLLIYKWNGSAYILAGHAYTHRCLFHFVWDAINWAREGHPSTALHVLEIARSNETIPPGCVGEREEVPFPLKTYIEFAVGMINVGLGNESEAMQAFEQAKKLDTENIYSPLIEIFWNSYRQHRHYLLACNDLMTYIEAYEDSRFRGPYKARHLVTFCPQDLASLSP